MHPFLVYNPKAAHGRASNRLSHILKAFDARGISYTLRLTESPGHAVKLIRETDLSPYDGVVAAGGDGTLFEAINGLMDNPDRKIPLGVLPVGTGNAFARDLYPDGSDWRVAVEMIARNTPRPVDVGCFESCGRTLYFLNILGLGFVADVVEVAHRLKAFGNIAYTWGVFYRLLFLRTHRVTLRVDGHWMDHENLFVEISNTRYTSNFLMAPSAKIDDGLLDVTLLGRMTRRRLLNAFPKIFTGDHVHLPEVETFQIREMTIETLPPKRLTPDGELLGETPTRVSCLRQAVLVYQ